MIALDIECSGLDFNKCGIWQIGAVDLDTGEEYLDECGIDDNDLILTTSESKRNIFDVIGRTEEQLRDKNKKSQKEMIEQFFDWVSKREKDIFLCMNPQFDLGYIWAKARKYGFHIGIQFRAFDLHTVAQMRHLETNKEFSFSEGKSKLSLRRICEFCGLDYPGNHQGLEDAKLTGECFYRLVYGESYFEDFKEQKIPRYLS
ncbi:MAG: exonuclease domain-containing protein [Candidatus Pacearchaeota archaeon]